MPGRRGEIRLDAGDLRQRQFGRHQPAVLHRLGARGDDIPSLLATRPVGIIERAVAVPRALHAGLAPGMGDLDRRQRAVLAQERRDRL